MPQRPDFESNVGPFRANQSFGQQSFPQADFGAQAMLSQFSSGGDVGVSMPHADPILGGDVGTLDGNGNMGFSNVYLDPALSQYPQQPNPNNYPSLDHLPYQPPQVDQFSTWLVGPDFDLEAFNASLRLSTSDDATAWEWLQNPVPTVELMVCTSMSDIGLSLIGRTSLFNYSSSSSTLYFPSFMRLHFGLAITVHCCFSPFALLAVFSWARTLRLYRL